MSNTGTTAAAARVPDKSLPWPDDHKAARLIAAEPLALLVGFLLDQQVPMEWAFAAPQRLKELRCSKQLVDNVGQLVLLHLRFYGYRDGEWSDSAVRRYVVDAGPLLPRLHKLVRSDCTTRNKRKAAALSVAYDTLEARIAELGAREELEAIRPDLDGNEIMTILGIAPGRLVGQAYQHLLALRMEHGPLGHDRAVEELTRWYAEQGH